MSVLIDNRQDYILVDEKLEAFTERVVKGVLDYEACETDYEVSISFVGNEEIRSLNVLYRDIDSATDVLSFPMLEFDETELMTDTIEDDLCEAEDDFDSDEAFLEAEIVEDEMPEDEMPLGDIVISMEKAKEQAEEYGHSFERELAFLLVHGMLHLLGYDHQTEKEEQAMFGRQEEILNKMKLLR